MKTFITKLFITTVYIITLNVIYVVFDFSLKSLVILVSSLILTNLLILETK